MAKKKISEGEKAIYKLIAIDNFMGIVLITSMAIAIIIILWMWLR